MATRPSDLPRSETAEMRARAEAFRDSWPSVSEGKALARDVVALTEMLVGLSADVTRWQGETTEAMEREAGLAGELSAVNDLLRAAEVRVKELEQQVSALPQAEDARELIGRELGRLYAAAEAFNTGDYEIMEDALRSVAGGGEEALARLAEALPAAASIDGEQEL